MRPLLLGLALLVGGCALTAPPDATVETREDLVRAFAARGWRATPVQFVRPPGVVGEGTAYRIEGRTVVVFDYGSPAEADAAAPDDSVRLLRLEAGRGVEVYRRPTLLVLTYGRMRTAFDLRLVELLTGPSLAPRGPPRGASSQ